VAELGNLTGGILLSPQRMSTVKIRAGSLFRTPVSRIGAGEAGFGAGSGDGRRHAFRQEPPKRWLGAGFPPSSTGLTVPSQVVHRRLAFGTCGKPVSRCRVMEYDFLVVEGRLKLIKTAAEVCPLCEGTGWKTLPASPSAPKDRRVTRCDCQLRARAGALLTAARIPKRYEHCELSNFEFDGPHLRLAPARMAACRFVEEYPVNRTGLLLVGKAGRGKTHLAVGIAKALISEKGVECVFYDYAELLKQIQDSYNPSVQATELDLLRPLFKTEVLVLDDLGSVRPTEWRWDTVRLILNTRYNDSLTTIITTNFSDEPAAAVRGPDKPTPSQSFAAARAAAREETLGDRIGEPMRSRLHEMCRVVQLEGENDFRETFLNATETRIRQTR
jgi:DNA replication protein DnaC